MGELWKQLGGLQSQLGEPQSQLGGPKSQLGGPQSQLGGPQSQLGGPQSQLGGPQSQLALVGGGTDGRTETKTKTRKTEKISLYGDAIGHRPLRGRCPLTTKLTELLTSKKLIRGHREPLTM